MNQEYPKILHPLEKLRLEHFDFTIPEALIAHGPLPERDQSKLLQYHGAGCYLQSMVKDLPTLLPPGSVLIFNNSKVFPSRLLGSLLTGGQVEVFLTRKDSSEVHKNSTETVDYHHDSLSNKSSKTSWWALGRPLKKLTPGKVLIFAAKNSSLTQNSPQLRATVLKREEDQVLIEFDASTAEVDAWLDRWGIIPLPPYIRRDDPKPAMESADRDRYQTVFAVDRGSVAAPTAGLHFSDLLMEELTAMGITINFVSLHVGAGTFLPVKSECHQDHHMHHESFMVPRHTLESIFKAKEANLPVIAVGTTSFRSLEDIYRRGDRNPEKILNLADQWHETNLYLYPNHKDDRYTPWMVDGLITNFHQPKSTLFMLISLLIGLENAKNFYQFAFENQYRLFSYGDSSLLWFKQRQ